MRIFASTLTLVALLLGTFPQPVNGAAVQPVALQDCLQMALERNLDIQIERYSSLFAENDLNIAYAGYEPALGLGSQRNFSRRGGGIDEFNRETPPSETTTDLINTDLNGVLPWTGMRYNLFMDLSESHGMSGRQTTNGVVIDSFDQTTGGVGINMTQPLLKNFLIDNVRFNILIARNRLKSSETSLRAQIINTVTAVELAYYDLIFARESVKVQEKALQLAERLLAENHKRVEVGALAPLDEKQAESQVAARRSDLLSAQRAVWTAQNTLRKLISDNYRVSHEVEFEPTEMLVPVAQIFDLQESWRRGLSLRPDVQQARLVVNGDQIDSRYYRNQVLPQLDLIGTYGHGASGTATREYADAFDNFRSGDRPFYTFGAQFSIPLGNTAARSRYHNSKLAVEQSQLILRKVEQDAMVQVDDSIKLARTNFERIDSTRQARLYAEAALDAEQKKLQNGKSTSFIVLQLQRDLTSARSEEIRALADYNKSLSQLALNEGSTLDRRNIDVRVK